MTEEKPKEAVVQKLIPAQGYEWNPLLAFPRNNKCFCGSKIKAKKCCLPKLPRAIGKEHAKAILMNWFDIESGKMTVKAEGFNGEP
jgi:hypothetical protein